MRLTLEERIAIFRSHVRQDESGCWIYEGRAEVNGYATITVFGRQMLAHRFAYELNVAPIPEGMQIDHLCRNRRCVNPDHLEAVTQRENLVRGFGFAGLNARKRECIHGHPFTPENTRVRPGRGRECRTCARARDRVRNPRRKGVMA